MGSRVRCVDGFGDSRLGGSRAPQRALELRMPIFKQGRRHINKVMGQGSCALGRLWPLLTLQV